MLITVSYFFPPDVVEQTTIECDMVPHSLAYFCSTCGEIWGRIQCSAAGKQPYWGIEHCPCLHHTPGGVPDWSRIPGTITDAFLTQNLLSKMWLGRALEVLPPATLRMEFTRLLNHYERNPQ